MSVSMGVPSCLSLLAPSHLQKRVLLEYDGLLRRKSNEIRSSSFWQTRYRWMTPEHLGNDHGNRCKQLQGKRTGLKTNRIGWNQLDYIKLTSKIKFMTRRGCPFLISKEADWMGTVISLWRFSSRFHTWLNSCHVLRHIYPYDLILYQNQPPWPWEDPFSVLWFPDFKVKIILTIPQNPEDQGRPIKREWKRAGALWNKMLHVCSILLVIKMILYKQEKIRPGASMTNLEWLPYLLIAKKVNI